MDPELFYAVVDDQLVNLELHREIPTAFLQAIPSNVDTIVNERAITIGGWDNSTDGPLVLALSSSGYLVSIVAINANQLDSLEETLVSIDTWLETMQLRDLSELSGNHVEFYEGLWELNPDSSIALAPVRRYILLTAVDELDISSLEAAIPGAEFSISYLDVLQAPNAPAIVRRRTTAHGPGAASSDVPSTVMAPDEPVHHETESFDLTDGADATDSVDTDRAVDVDTVVDSPVDVDLTSVDHDIFIALDPEQILLESGKTFLLDELPLIFDPAGTSLESISDELFAARDNIVIVATLPERRRDSPFKERNSFRWDTSPSRIRLLNDNSFNPEGTRRTVQLFVESDRDPSLATYVGVLNRIAFQTQAHVESETAWFSIEPALDQDLHRTLRKGRLPQVLKSHAVEVSQSQSL